MSVLLRNNVHIRGKGERMIMFGHGFGCDQTMWRLLTPMFERDFVTVLFDYVGCGKSNVAAYTAERYCTLNGYAKDVTEIVRELGMEHGVFVGHSVSATIGAMASIELPNAFGDLIMVAPNPCFINDKDYVGGFTRSQIDELMESIEDDFPAWAAAMAPAIMGNPDRPELSNELRTSFCQMDPEIAKLFARAVFTSDHREMLSAVRARSLILQCTHDAIAPTVVGEYVQSRLSQSELVFLDAGGHCPHLSHPMATANAIIQYMGKVRARAAISTDGSSTKSNQMPDMSPGAESVYKGRPRPALSAGAPVRHDLLRRTLITRVGELRFHLGRYDMYAISLASFVTRNYDGDDGIGIANIESRGRHIVAAMELRDLSSEHVAEMRNIDGELQTVLARQIIAARHGASITGSDLDAPHSGATTAAVDWFDFERATTAQLKDHIAAVEQDILTVITLSLRITNCAQKIKLRLRLH
jgi:sigma-B regulation protein RsbQ